MDNNKRTLLKAACAVLPAYALHSSYAQDAWKPSKNITLLVPSQAGGNSDLLARIISNEIGNQLGYPMIVDNKPGASGTIGSMQLSRSPADGHFLLTASSDTHTVYPQFFENRNFVPEQHVPVGIIAYVPFALAARKDLGVKTVADLIALAKTKQLTYSSWGFGTTGHAAMLLFLKSAGIQDALHVPFTGSGPAIQALMAGQVDLMMGAIPLISSSRSLLQPLAVMSHNRSVALPDIPTLDESGVKIKAFKEFWVGIVAPPKTPRPIVDRLAQQIKMAMEQPHIQKKMTELGAIAEFAGPDEFKKVIQNEFNNWQTIIKNSGIEKQIIK